MTSDDFPRATLAAPLLALAFLVSTGMPVSAQAPGTVGGSGDGPSEAASGEGETGGEGSKEEETFEPDPTTPRGAVELYFKACNEGRYRDASGFLDLERADTAPGSERAATLAWQLKVVLDQRLWIDVEDLSTEPEGNTQDGSARKDRLGSIDTDRGTVHVSVERITTEDEVRVWRFSSSTVTRVPYLYDRFGYGPLGEHLPEVFLTWSLFQVRLWQWIGFALLAMVAYGLSWVTIWIVVRILRPAVRRTRTEVDDRVLSALVGPARALLSVVVFSAGTLFLHLAVPVMTFLGHLEKAAGAVAATWIVIRLIDVFSDVLERRFENQERRAAVAVLPLGRKTVKVVVLFLAGVTVLQLTGFNVTGVIASLGIGGLAVALAAQRSLENVFAGVSLISDQPVRIGDMCKFGDRLGTVEDVGLRSTKVRTLDRSVVAVPNSQFAELHLENLAQRDYIRFYTVLGLRYETRADQLRHVILELRKMLIAHPRVSLEPFWRVRFIGFGAYSLDVEVFVYTRTTDYGEFRAIQEDLLLRIMDVVEASGTGFAFPSQTTYLGRDAGLDDERGDEAVESVRKMREGGDLPFPDFGSDAVADLEDTASYPPEGAAGGTETRS